MNNIKKRLSQINDIVSGLGIILLGVFVVLGSTSMYKKVINLFVCIFLIYGLAKFVNFILNKKIVRNKQVLIKIVLNIFFGLIFLLFPMTSLIFLPFIFSIYLMFNSLVRFIDYVILSRNNFKLRFENLFFSLFFLIFSYMFLFYPIKRLNLFIIIIGFYCIILGLNLVYSFIISLISEKFKIKIKKKLKITLPVFLEAFIPKEMLKDINDYFSNSKQNIESDLKIFLHLSKYKFNQFGHIDVLYNGIIYSYGNYDKSSQKLFTAIGDGVLFNVKGKFKYIDFCIKNSGKTIVEYGLKLTDTQKRKIEKKINKINSNLVEWKPPVITLGEGIDYASKLYLKTNAKFYKFKNSEYKKYFVLGVNCTYFIDKLLRESTNILKLVGIITPGTYFEYLEENYNKPNSNIVSKLIYNSENIGEFYDENKE